MPTATPPPCSTSPPRSPPADLSASIYWGPSGSSIAAAIPTGMSQRTTVQPARTTPDVSAFGEPGVGRTVGSWAYTVTMSAETRTALATLRCRLGRPPRGAETGRQQHWVGRLGSRSLRQGVHKQLSGAVEPLPPTLHINLVDSQSAPPTFGQTRNPRRTTEATRPLGSSPIRCGCVRRVTRWV